MEAVNRSQNQGTTASSVQENLQVLPCKADADKPFKVTEELKDEYGSLKVVNIFAFRSTDPAALYEQPDPIGPGNDEAILQATKSAGIVICGWGTDGSLRGRGEKVIELLRENGITPHYLKLNKDGSPGNPLYIAYSVQPKPFPLHQ